MSGLSSILLTARIGSTRPNIATSWELQIITMVVLGSVNINGGSGSILGVFIAAFLMGFITYGMGLVNVPGIEQTVLTGALLILAIAMPSFHPTDHRHAEASLEKIAFLMQLKHGQAAEYQRRHDEIWPELVALLKDSGISDYSIFLKEEAGRLFAVLTRSADHRMDVLLEAEVMRRWWRYMADIMLANPDQSPVVTPLRQVFYLP